MTSERQPPKKKPGKRLLVASIGVATMTYVGSTTGCVVDHEDDPVGSGNLLAPPSVEPALRNDGGAHDASAADAYVSGNLLPPPSYLDASGNLLPPPDAALHDASDKDGSDKDASSDAGKKDSSVFEWDALPPTGNLLPPPVQ